MSGDENMVQVMTGSKIDEYQLFDYEWLYTGIHKIANHAQRAMRELLERGNFDLYDSQYFDAQVSWFNCCLTSREVHESVIYGTKDEGSSIMPYYEAYVYSEHYIYSTFASLVIEGLG